MAACVSSRLAARGETPAWHRGRRGAPRARRDDREYREYLSEEQSAFARLRRDLAEARSPLSPGGGGRRRRGCLARRMQLAFHHGLLERSGDGWRKKQPLGVLVEEHPEPVNPEDGAERNVQQIQDREHQPEYSGPGFTVEQTPPGRQAGQRQQQQQAAERGPRDAQDRDGNGRIARIG